MKVKGKGIRDMIESLMEMAETETAAVQDRKSRDEVNKEECRSVCEEALNHGRFIITISTVDEDGCMNTSVYSRGMSTEDLVFALTKGEVVK